MMNDYMYVGGVAAIAVLLGLLLYVRGSRKEAEHEEVIEVGMADEAVVPEEPVVRPFPKENKIKLPEPKAPKPLPLIEVATKSVTDK